MMRFTLIWIAVAGLLAGTCTPAQAQSAFGEPRDRAYYEKRGDIVWEVPMEQKLIAFTFDDGPNPKQTVQILDLLREYGAKATFFVVGNRAAKFPSLVRLLALDGHEIANHTYHHAYYNRNRNLSSLLQEIESTRRTVEEIAGVTTQLFRSPGGYYSEAMVNEVKRSGHRFVLWSWHQDTEDWKSPPVAKIVNKVLQNARNGDIVLFHDHVERSSNTPAALAQILPELTRRGFRFVTVSELLATKPVPHEKQQLEPFLPR